MYQDFHKRVLIVTPNWPPVAHPDMHRVRMSVPYLEEFGWRPTILAVKPRYVEGIKDDNLLKSVPRGLSAIWTSALPAEITRPVGLGSLALRALPFLYRAGAKALASETFDLVYFSTTLFPVLALGPIWKRKFGVPFAIDLQDPWINSYHKDSQGQTPPGGKLKHNFHQLIARKFEPKVMKNVSQIIVVSPAYAETLQRRYSWLSDSQFTTLPFGAPENDFQLLPKLRITQNIFDPHDGFIHWVYVGRGGADLGSALRLLFRAISQERQRSPDNWCRIRLYFIGTDYAAAGHGKETVKPIADSLGVGDLVVELTDRQPYFEALASLNAADALLIIGSDSPGYTPSKLYPYVLAKRPILALLHHSSPAVEIFKTCGCGELVEIGRSDSESELLAVRAAVRRLLIGQPNCCATDWTQFSRYTAREMTRTQCQVFDRALNDRLTHVIDRHMAVRK